MTRGQVAVAACPVCASIPKPSASYFKFGVRYWSCSGCGAIFSEDIDPQKIITHNDDPDGRCDVEVQKVRLRTVHRYLGRMPQTVLDFGCGRGELADFLKSSGIEAVGIDQDTALQLPCVSDQSVDAVIMVEVIEHLRDPLGIMEQIRRILKPDGVVYVESSFVDFIGDPIESAYVDPRIGHCCIHSKRSIAYVRRKLGLQAAWVNDNVVVLCRFREALRWNIRNCGANLWRKLKYWLKTIILPNPPRGQTSSNKRIEILAAVYEKNRDMPIQIRITSFS